MMFYNTRKSTVVSKVCSCKQQRKHHGAESVVFREGNPLLIGLLGYAPVPLLRILSANQYEMAFVAHRTAPYWFELLGCHFRSSSQANTNVLKCSKHSYWPCESKPIRIASLNVVSIRVSSYWDSPPVCCDSVRCNTMRNDRTRSCKFLLVPIVFSSHHNAIVLIPHHHRTASYCIVIVLHLIASHRIVSIRVYIGRTLRQPNIPKQLTPKRGSQSSLLESRPQSYLMSLSGNLSIVQARDTPSGRSYQPIVFASLWWRLWSPAGH